MSNRDNARMKAGPKMRGIVNLPYEVLEDWLRLKPGSIRNVFVRHNTECVEIVHDDEDPVFGVTFNIYPGSEIPRTTPRYEKMGNPLKEKSPPA